MTAASLAPWIAAGLLACLTAGAAPAQDAPVLSLADVVRLAGESNPRAMAAHEAVVAAHADRDAAGKLRNPTVSYDRFRPSGGGRTVFDGSRQEGVTVELPLPLPGQRSSRIAKANADLAAAEARAVVETGSLAGDALISFSRLLAAQTKVEVLDRTFADVTRLKNAVGERRTAGAASDYDVTRLEVELSSLGNRLETTRAETAVEAAQLATLLALPSGLPVADGALHPFELPSDLLSGSALEPRQAPSAVAAAREAAAADAAVETAKHDRLPEVGVSGGRTWTRSPYGAADYIGLSAELPIFDGRRAQLDKAKADARAAEARRRGALAESAALIRQLQQTLVRRQAAFDRQRVDVLPRLERLKQMSADAYTLGRLSLLESIDAEQARLDVTLENIETIAALLETQVRLLTATGRLPVFMAQLPR